MLLQPVTSAIISLTLAIALLYCSQTKVFVSYQFAFGSNHSSLGKQTFSPEHTIPSNLKEQPTHLAIGPFLCSGNSIPRVQLTDTQNRAAVAPSGWLCTSSIAMSHRSDSLGSPPPLSVIIVGAGFAGLSAARTLSLNSVSVTVLEASDAIGGRAKAGQLSSGTPVELGATWFHGVRDNPVYDLGVITGLVKDVRQDPEAQKHDIDWQLHFARPMEHQLLAGELNTVAMEAVGRYTEAAEECTQGAQLGDYSVGDVLRRTFDEAVSGDKLEGSALQTFADAWHFREKLQRTFDGFFSTDDVSLAFAREYEALDGPNLPVPGGYQGLANILSQGLDIRTGHKVTRIKYSHLGAVVTCSNGAVFEADCVLVTTSLGVLQKTHQTLFEPTLPDWKVDAMSALRIGVADKVFVEFEIAKERMRDAAIWLSSHATSHASPAQGNVTPGTSGHTASAFPSPSPEHVSSQPSPGYNCQPAFPSPQGPPERSDSPQLPLTVLAALPPRAAGGQPEPFNIGKKGAPVASPAPVETIAARPSFSEDSCVSSATATALAQHVRGGSITGGWEQGRGAVTPSSTDRSSLDRRRRRKLKRTIHSYAFLWPVANPLAQGVAGHPALTLSADAALSSPICVDNLGPMPKHDIASLPAGLPSWLQGLHSIRYCPGPEWIEPSLLEESVASGKRPASASSRMSPCVNPLDGGATHVSGVLWITGNAALEMEQASDADVQKAVAAMFSLFPQVPLPPGAKMPPKVLRSCWGTDPNHYGSYSYINVTEVSGDAIDALAEPLCNDQGIPIVLFAGEATHRQYIGTVHGAFLSGCREAERLLELLRLAAATSPSCTKKEMRLSVGLTDVLFSELMVAGSPNATATAQHFNSLPAGILPA